MSEFLVADKMRIKWFLNGSCTITVYYSDFNHYF